MLKHAGPTPPPTYDDANFVIDAAASRESLTIKTHLQVQQKQTAKLKLTIPISVKQQSYVQWFVDGYRLFYLTFHSKYFAA